MSKPMCAEQWLRGPSMLDASNGDLRGNGTHLNSLEAQVLAGLAGGATGTEVALKLFVYEGAVRRLYRSAIKKIGARDHAQAMAWARQHLATPPDLVPASGG